MLQCTPPKRKLNTDSTHVPLMLLSTVISEEISFQSFKSNQRVTLKSTNQFSKVNAKNLTLERPHGTLFTQILILLLIVTVKTYYNLRFSNLIKMEITKKFRLPRLNTASLLRVTRSLSQRRMDQMQISTMLTSKRKNPSSITSLEAAKSVFKQLSISLLVTERLLILNHSIIGIQITISMSQQCKLLEQFFKVMIQIKSSRSMVLEESFLMLRKQLIALLLMETFLTQRWRQFKTVLNATDIL